VPERWFTDDELDEMARPTMEVAIEAIDRGDTDTAKELCERERHESQFMHDMLVDGMAGLISFVKEKLGDEGVGEAWQYSLERSWRKPVETIAATDRKLIARSLAATWRAHSTSGVGPKPGAFEIDEDEEKLTFTMNPCGSGQRLWRNGRYGPDGWGVTDEAHDWSYGRKGFPLYCTHCAFMNESPSSPWYSLMTVFACAFNATGASYFLSRLVSGSRWLASWHFTTQVLQPMQSVAS